MSTDPILFSFLSSKEEFTKIQINKKLPKEILCYNRKNRFAIKNIVEKDCVEITVYCNDAKKTKSNKYILKNASFEDILFAYSYDNKQLIYKR